MNLLAKIEALEKRIAELERHQTVVVMSMPNPPLDYLLKLNPICNVMGLGEE